MASLVSDDGFACESFMVDQDTDSYPSVAECRTTFVGQPGILKIEPPQTIGRKIPGSNCFSPVNIRYIGHISGQIGEISGFKSRPGRLLS